MKVGINGYEAVVPRFGFDKNGNPYRVGSSEFCYRLIRSLFDIDRENEYSIYLPVEPTKDMPKRLRGWKYEVFSSPALWTMLGLSRMLVGQRKRLDVFFSPTHYAPLLNPVPSVISILDVSYLKFPAMFKKKDLYKLKLWGGYSIKNARKIITISESSRNDIIEEYHVDPKKVEVIYPGVKKHMANQKPHNLASKYGISGKYVLFVGTIQPRKNIEKLIESFSTLKSPNLQLVIVGRKGWMFEEILNAPKKYGVEEKVKFIHDATDEDLPLFYKNAEMFVLPSLYEGFGLPILEAMQEGCPVITSNVSSLPEAGGDAALYVDPEDASDIAEKMQSLLKDEKMRDELIKKGYQQVKKFSWEKSAKKTLSILSEVANER